MKQIKNLESRQGISIREVMVVADNIYFRTADGDQYRVWVGLDNQPCIELIERG